MHHGKGLRGDIVNMRNPLRQRQLIRTCADNRVERAIHLQRSRAAIDRAQYRSQPPADIVKIGAADVLALSRIEIAPEGEPVTRRFVPPAIRAASEFVDYDDRALFLPKPQHSDGGQVAHGTTVTSRR